MFNRKKKKKDESLVLNDYHEEFSWRVFWDEQVVGRIKKIRQFLKDHGILFFLLSPFQYKNRLITKLCLIVFGILLGIVPRSIQMVNAIKERNADTELSQVKDTTTGAITVHALGASQYKKQHVMVFEIQGDTKDGVPSTTGGFSVTLTTNRGVDDMKHVAYRYKILPISTSNRLLVLYVDNRKQQDDTGIFNLDVHVKGTQKMDTPLEVVLSNTQKTNSLFGKHGISLVSLSDPLTNDASSGADKTAIKKAKKDLDDKLSVYKVNQERLAQLHMQITPDYDQVKKYVKQNLILPKVSDKSTVDVVTSDDVEQPLVPDMTVSIKYKGKTYSSTDSQNSQNDESSDDASTNPARDTELGNLTSYFSDIQSAISALNQARLTKYTALANVQAILTQHVKISTMTKVKHVER